MDNPYDTRRTDNRADEALGWLCELLEQSCTQFHIRRAFSAIPPCATLP
jgi:hypothetical protein